MPTANEYTELGAVVFISLTLAVTATPIAVISPSPVIHQHRKHNSSTCHLIPAPSYTSAEGRGRCWSEGQPGGPPAAAVGGRGFHGRRRSAIRWRDSRLSRSADLSPAVQLCGGAVLTPPRCGAAGTTQSPDFGLTRYWEDTVGFSGGS